MIPPPSLTTDPTTSRTRRCRSRASVKWSPSRAAPHGPSCLPAGTPPPRHRHPIHSRGHRASDARGVRGSAWMTSSRSSVTRSGVNRPASRKRADAPSQVVTHPSGCTGARARTTARAGPPTTSPPPSLPSRETGATPQRSQGDPAEAPPRSEWWDGTEDWPVRPPKLDPDGFIEGVIYTPGDAATVRPHQQAAVGPRLLGARGRQAGRDGRPHPLRHAPLLGPPAPRGQRSTGPGGSACRDRRHEPRPMPLVRPGPRRARPARPADLLDPLPGGAVAVREGSWGRGGHRAARCPGFGTPSPRGAL